MRKPPSRLPLGLRASSSDSRNRVGAEMRVATVAMRLPTSLTLEALRPLVGTLHQLTKL
jgi:hypothetical protein